MAQRGRGAAAGGRQGMENSDRAAGLGAGNPLRQLSCQGNKCSASTRVPVGVVGGRA